MGNGSIDNPFLREDIVRLIEENGRTAQDLNLSNKEFADGIDLRGLKLQRIILKSVGLEKAHLEGTLLTGAHLEGAFLKESRFDGARLSGAHLEGAELVSCHLENAHLAGAHLERADFFDAHLERCDLTNAFLENTRISGAYLQGCYMFDTKFSANTEMESVDWGNYVLGEEIEGNKKEKGYYFKWAIDTYRRLKIWYTEHGLYDIAGKFFYREMETRRKAQNWKKEPYLKLWSWIMRLLCGYGEKPILTVLSAVMLILLCTFVYFGLNSWSAFGHSLYFSAVSFTAVGYGGWIDKNWINVSSNWIKGIGVAESFLGVFMMALFLVTFTRKMTR
ncbi:MAG: pentapeptide repeat-containing protein [Dehalococcoidales bacterium]|jgi:hypothetical protein